MPGQGSERRISANTLQVPEGGGAVRGIADSFEPQAFTGAATLSISIPAQPIRDVAPELTLGYSSGGGNGPFGVGFALSLPSIARKTSNGIPRYQKSDVFVHSAEGDLVPALVWDDTANAWVTDIRAEPATDPVWDVIRFRPRRESSFTTIERWTSRLNGGSHWRVLTADNTSGRYGVTADGRISDPAHPERVFQWLLQELTDSRGNKVRYHYKPEDDVNVPPAIYEQGRDHRANRYISRIEYGNYVLDGTERFAGQVAFDYGGYSVAEPERPPGDWLARPDPFSTYRSGFEVRTLRRCRAILIFHCFAGQFDGQPFLVRAIGLEYGQAQADGISFVRRVTETGFRKLPDGSYLTASYPPVDLGYSKFEPGQQNFGKLTVEGDGSLPSYLGAGRYLLVDLGGEGLPGILYSDDTSTLFWEPAGDGRFAGPVNPPGFPAESDLAGTDLVLTSLLANGQPEIMVNENGRAGYYRSDGASGWEPFRPFPAAPTDLLNPLTELVDMTGAGRADLTLLDPPVISTWPSLGLDGFGPAEQAPVRADFPARGGQGALEVLTFADVFGDGLSHRVRITDGEVACWPNLGYGRFGPKVRLGDAPAFEGGFDPGRLYLADVDGSGPVDLLYLQTDRVQVYFSRSGNGFSAPLSIPLPTSFDNISQVSFGDVYGNGTSCLILTQLSPAPVHYVYDFAGDSKPYLLTSVANQMGSTTVVRYTTSVKQYLQDRRAGRSWATKLYFPIQVIASVERTEETTGTRYVTRYRYHDGYYDPQYREFDGFGFVETWDTEEYSDFLLASAAPGGTIKPIEAADYVPPVYTRTWFHTGALLDAAVISRQYTSEYWAGDPEAFDRPESSFDSALDEANGETLRQAYAALAGTLLRQEVYGLDGSAAARTPYRVEEACYHVRLVQPRESHRFAVFFVYQQQALGWQYDRNPADPRLTHEFALEVDEFGNTTRAGQVAYPRRERPEQPSYPEQRDLVVTLAQASYANHVETDAEPYRWIGVEVERREYEVAGLTRPDGHFGFDQFQAETGEALDHRLAFGQPFTSGQREARLFAWTRSYYWDEALADALPLRRISAQGLLHHEETAVAPPALVAEIFDGKGDPVELMRTGGFWLNDGYWWNRGLIRRYLAEPEAFCLPGQVDGEFAGVDPESSLNPTTAVVYDPYYVLPVEVRRYLHGSGPEAVCLRVLGDNDYQVMLPWRVTDHNDNVTEVGFDPLGVVVVSTFFGVKNGVPVGDDPLSDYTRQPDPTFWSIVDDAARFLQNAASFFYYDLFAWVDRRKPPCAVGLHRRDYVHAEPAPGAGPGAEPQIGITYSDGLGRIIENRLKTEPGTDGQPRWIVSGEVTYNNKGLVLRSYLPHFSPAPEFEPDRSAARQLPPPTVSHYDPLGRLIRVDSAKGFFSRTSYSPWTVRAYDQDDTVLDAAFYQNFPANPTTPAGRAERAALDQAAAFYNTPAVAILDSLGRTARVEANNLGAVTPAVLAPVVDGSGKTPQQVFDELVGYGYLTPDETAPDQDESSRGWVSDLVRPYDRGFQQRFAGQFDDLAAPLAWLLKENGLTTLQVLDVAGNTLAQVDPRLLYSNVVSGTDYRNVVTAYDMADVALVAHSTDAGSHWSLSDVFGNQLLTWDGRSFQTSRRFDRLGRPVRVTVSEPAGPPQVTEVISYGEDQPDPAQRNLNGQVYQYFDPAGLVTTSAYTITDLVAVSIRQVRADYEQEADWTPQAMAAVAAQPAYQTGSRFDPLGNLIAQTTPDGTQTVLSYNVAGQLAGVNVQAPGLAAAVVERVEYDATGLRTQVRYGNGTATRYGYEDTTLRLVMINSTGPDRELQDIAYTFDPVGNVTQIENRSWQAAFCYQQAVSPSSEYRYDALYRLLASTGRQAPTAAGSGVMSFCPPPPDRHDLVPYSQKFGYDDGGNLITVEHIAPASSVRRFEIAPDSNRLEALPYDDNGNVLAVGDLSQLDWSFGNALARAGLTGGRGEDRYLYDSGNQRVLKVERRTKPDGEPLGSERTIYVGGYQLSRTESPGEQPAERHAVSVLDDRTRVCLVTRDAETGVWSLRYQLGDNLGSVAWETDGDGQPLNYQEYFAYGSSAFLAAADAGQAARKEFRHAGKQLDAQTELYYYGARYYSPDFCRWLSPDPAGTATGLNMYVFVESNPVSKVDTDGGVEFWVIFGSWALGAVITIAVGTIGGRRLGHGRGIASGIFMGTLAGLAGTLTGGGLAYYFGGATTQSIAMVAVHSTLAALAGSAIGGPSGQLAMGPTSDPLRHSYPRLVAGIGTFVSGVIGGLLGYGISRQLSGSVGASTLISIATGLGSAVLSSGAHLGFIRRGTAFVSAVLLPYSQRARIVPAIPLPKVVHLLPADKLLLVMAPQDEAKRRYKQSFKGHEIDAYKVPGQGATNFNVVAVHGFHETVLVSTAFGGHILRPMSIYDFARYVKRQLKENRFAGPIKFISCFGASWALTKANAQVLANVTRRTVWAFKGPQMEDFAGTWRRFDPK